MVINCFNDEQRVLLNGICMGIRQKELTKERVKELLIISKENVNDDMVLELIDSTFDDLDLIKEDDWNELKAFLPFEVDADYEDDDFDFYEE